MLYQAGGHVSLEQPRNAMSWLKAATQGFLLDISADLVVVAACAFDFDFFKPWIFASSWQQSIKQGHETLRKRGRKLGRLPGKKMPLRRCLASVTRMELLRMLTDRLQRCNGPRPSWALRLCLFQRHWHHFQCILRSFPRVPGWRGYLLRS